jgi:UDP-3-O-[3-hydroxymyristoyl] glucosamine N-acyltransferase
MPLTTLAEYITAARTQLQDENATVKRYTDAEMAEAMGLSMLEMRRVRPELFNSIAGAVSSVQSIDRATPTNTTVVMDEQYRTALLYGMIAHVISRDEEEVSQGMADKYMTRFVSKLLAIAA